MNEPFASENFKFSDRSVHTAQSYAYNTILNIVPNYFFVSYTYPYNLNMRNDIIFHLYLLIVIVPECFGRYSNSSDEAGK